MSRKIKVCCLPVSSINDPYQALMMEGLSTNNHLKIIHGLDNKFFGILLTGLIKRPDYIHFDWNYRYFLRKQKWLTWVSIPSFFIQLYIVKYLLRCNLVWSMHNIQSHENTNQIKEEEWVQHRFAHLCDWVRLFSYSAIPRAAQYLQVPTDKFRVSYHASFFGCYPNKVSQNEARAFLGIKPDDFVLLHFGTIRPYKGLDTLINAFKRIPGDNIRLVVAGKPHKKEYLPDIQKMLAEDSRIISFLAFIEDEKVQYFFNASDIVVLPYTDIENSGPTLIAMMFSKPVLAPRLGFLAERLSAQPQLLYIQGNLEEALKRIDTFSREQLNALGKANYDDIKKSNWRHFAQFFN